LIEQAARVHDAAETRVQCARASAVVNRGDQLVVGAHDQGLEKQKTPEVMPSGVRVGDGVLLSEDASEERKAHSLVVVRCLGHLMGKHDSSR
jgi:hypothetical protein